MITPFRRRSVCTIAWKSGVKLILLRSRTSAHRIFQRTQDRWTLTRLGLARKKMYRMPLGSFKIGPNGPNEAQMMPKPNRIIWVQTSRKQPNHAQTWFGPSCGLDLWRSNCQFGPKSMIQTLSPNACTLYLKYGRYMFNTQHVAGSVLLPHT
jgi:hypothetical protein